MSPSSGRSNHWPRYIKINAMKISGTFPHYSSLMYTTAATVEGASPATGFHSQLLFHPFCSSSSFSSFLPGFFSSSVFFSSASKRLVLLLPLLPRLDCDDAVSFALLLPLLNKPCSRCYICLAYSSRSLRCYWTKKNENDTLGGIRKAEVGDNPHHEPRETKPYDHPKKEILEQQEARKIKKKKRKRKKGWCWYTP